MIWRTLLARWRLWFSLAHDTILGVIAIHLSLWIRLGSDGYLRLPAESLIQASVLMGVSALAADLVARGYRSSWRYFSTTDVMALARTTALALLFFLPLSFLATRVEFIPRSTYVINGLLLIAALAGPRLLYRMIVEGRLSILPSRVGDGAIPALIVGGGAAAEAFLRSITQSRRGLYRPLGIIDDTPARVGAVIQGVPIIGTTDQLEAILEDAAVRGDLPHKLVVAEDRREPEKLRRYLELAERFGLGLSRAPSPTDLRHGVEDEPVVRPLLIEDLLGRPQAVLDLILPRQAIEGRRVLITGAGGSIGSELARQIASLAPAHLVLSDLSEFNLYSIDMEIAERNPQVNRSARLLDVRDGRAVRALFAREQPEVVFHAAALKHVPIVEEHPLEGLETNVFGTRNVADAAIASQARVMVLISTDKAVHPSNVMGATKRLAESYCQALDVDQRRRGESTRFVTVRFGNVLGSTGSVVPLFQRQLANGGPLTVTHPEVTRYFMTISEAVALVLQASGLGAAGGLPAGDIVVLDMGDPIKIADLARQMIRLAGLRPDVDVAIRYVGLRKGEKLYEELFYANEKLRPTAIPGVQTAEPQVHDLAWLAQGLAEIDGCMQSGDVEQTLSCLRRLVPDFRSGAAA